LSKATSTASNAPILLTVARFLNKNQELLSSILPGLPRRCKVFYCDLQASASGSGAVVASLSTPMEIAYPPAAGAPVPVPEVVRKSDVGRMI